MSSSTIHGDRVHHLRTQDSRRWLHVVVVVRSDRRLVRTLHGGWHCFHRPTP